MKRLFLYKEDLGAGRLEDLVAVLSGLPYADGDDGARVAFDFAHDALRCDGAMSLGAFGGHELLLADAEFALSLKAALNEIGKRVEKFGAESCAELMSSHGLRADDAVVGFEERGAALCCLTQGRASPLRLDFERPSVRQRLLRGGRQKEAVARAVLQGLDADALVFDATAGLGRESMILAHAGCRLCAFERQLPVWLILADALRRIRSSRFFPFALPKLQPLGTIENHDKAAGRPEVIYYDPMFPESDASSQVKKDMRIFRQIIGQDEDTPDFAERAFEMAEKRLVIKRPASAPPLESPKLARDYFVDGGQCRFDCYGK